MEGKSTRDVVLYRAHMMNAASARAFKKLQEELPNYDHFVLGYSEDANMHVLSAFLKKNILLIGKRELRELDYPKRLHDSNNQPRGEDPVLLWFFRHFNQYDYYWSIEYDVRYSGSWLTLFEQLALSQADLLATNVYDYKDLRNWPQWSNFDWSTQNIENEGKCKAFLPFCRLSRRALLVLDVAFRQGLTGHFETTFATVCRLKGLLIEDVGGYGPYTPESRQGKHYTSTPNADSLSPGSFVFRPAIRDLDFENLKSLFNEALLFHPIK